MPRPKGMRAPGFEEKRRELLGRIRTRLGEKGATHASWRELAAAAGVGLSTMTHYFGKRDEVIRAVLDQERADSALGVARLAAPGGDFATSLADAADEIVMHLHARGGDSLTIALINGLAHPDLGPAALETVLEPWLAALEQRLAAHVERGEMANVQPRHAALAFAAPLILAHLHQEQLGGRTQRPLDPNALAATHIGAFIRAYGKRGEAAAGAAPIAF
ncbi:TetR/AcrR family transcriptional regulator [Sphingosinicella sp. YJ22]|uniref:TetR/AcrR family transcriptional regulator n=1 Tax=Sphingosinicella sp. YJ22 TaxID=1104780 RepID=UPI001409EA2A|nr:TetR/AcrR family transcriptional regulator [Sphingosinicella sp. YJ22]